VNVSSLGFFGALEDSKNILIAGAGGGYDVFCGLPLYFNLKSQGKRVHLANLSFADIVRSTGREITESLVEVKATTEGYGSYFPELFLSRWFATQDEKVSICAFENTGVKPLTEAYKALVKLLEVDTVVLVDGGTDSLMRGDEIDLATPEEDAASIAAVMNLENVPTKLLACLGFGMDKYHGVCHANFLEATAALTQSNHFLGAWSLLPQMPEVHKYREAAEFTFTQMAHHPSIVSSSIIDGIAGEFGNFHRTNRTEGSELFINPLMGLYWGFELAGVAKRNLYLDRIQNTLTRREISREIILFRSELKEIKPWQALPM
jgi:hypothetical protein